MLLPEFGAGWQCSYSGTINVCRWTAGRPRPAADERREPGQIQPCWACIDGKNTDASSTAAPTASATYNDDVWTWTISKYSYSSTPSAAPASTTSGQKFVYFERQSAVRQSISGSSWSTSIGTGVVAKFTAATTFSTTCSTAFLSSSTFECPSAFHYSSTASSTAAAAVSANCLPRTRVF